MTKEGLSNGTKQKIEKVSRGRPLMNGDLIMQMKKGGLITQKKRLMTSKNEISLLRPCN